MPKFFVPAKYCNISFSAITYWRLRLAVQTASWFMSNEILGLVQSARYWSSLRGLVKELPFPGLVVTSCWDPLVSPHYWSHWDPCIPMWIQCMFSVRCLWNFWSGLFQHQWPWLVHRQWHRKTHGYLPCNPYLYLPIPIPINPCIYLSRWVQE